jgi:hypothetical protein
MEQVEGVTNAKALEDVMYHLLETELGGEKIYEAAIAAAVHEELKEEWEKYLDETREHIEIARGLVEACGLDPDKETPGRLVLRKTAETFVEGIERAVAAGDPAAAELTAAEHVTLAETKDHLNWEIVSMLAKRASGELGRALREAVERVEPQEDEHLYHTQGWTRELWLAALGLPAVLPPPEERKDVRTAIGAARAKAARGPSARRAEKHDDEKSVEN